MKEETLLENTMDILENESYEKGYEYLKNNYVKLPKGNYPEVYYYFICITAALGKKEEALKWFQEAIEDKGFWYRPEVLEDDDLESIMGDSVFINLKSKSDERYKKALNESKSFCTWKEKSKASIMLCLHGNTENAKKSLDNWSKIKNESLQIEALQSSSVDCYDNFRWNYDNINYKELSNCINHISWETYKNKYLAGFSAGCDMILRTLALTQFKCNKVFLQCPWIPFLQDNEDIIVKACLDKGIIISIHRGEKDEDTKEMCEKLYKVLKNGGVEVYYYVHKGIRHGFPENMNEGYDLI